ncbi:MAG: HGGxSTG domain-containing protein [Gammaproteobacteria bacterium]
MSAIYIDRNGNIRLSWFCNDPRKPRKLRGVCGAKTRKASPCQAPPVWDKSQDKPRNGRCKLHGGLSTGAKTETGREAIRASNRRRGKIFQDNI